MPSNHQWEIPFDPAHAPSEGFFHFAIGFDWFDQRRRETLDRVGWSDMPAVAAEILESCGRTMQRGKIARSLAIGASLAGLVVEGSVATPIEQAVEAATFLHRVADFGLYDRRRVRVSVRCEPSGQSSVVLGLRFAFA